MSNNVHLVVGNSYGAFAETTAAITYDQAQELLPSLDGSHVLVCGQGLTAEQLSELARAAARLHSAPRLAYAEESCPAELTHKRDPRYVLITTPQRIATRTYRMLLRVEPQQDRLADHVTGQHVNGMVMIEAARQATIAVIERECPHPEGKRWSIAWARCEVSFLAFAFPVPTTLTVTVEATGDATSSQVPLSFMIRSTQGDIVVAEQSMVLTLLDPSISTRLEGRRARQTASQVMTQCSELLELAKLA